MTPGKDARDRARECDQLVQIATNGEFQAIVAFSDALVSEDDAAKQDALIGTAAHLLRAFATTEASLSDGDGEAFQGKVQPWLLECFGPMIAGDREERNHRFLEESLELVRACGCTASEAHQLVDYVFGRPVGELHQEIGGVMVTLAALCLANDADMHAAGWVELNRIWGKVEAIRAKQAAKPKHSPLPIAETTLSGKDGAGEVDEYMSVTLSRDGTVTSHNAFDADFDEMVKATETIVRELQRRLSDRKYCPYSHGGEYRSKPTPDTILRSALEQECERCAKVAEDYAEAWRSQGASDEEKSANLIAAAIRDLGDEALAQPKGEG